MSTPNERPIDFCLHLAAAIRQDKKTLAYKPLPFASATRFLASKTQPAPMYGAVGGLLWMREPYAIGPDGIVDYPATRASTRYDARISDSRWSIAHASTMTRAQASIMLKLVEVAVVRLSDDLTEDRARAAGMTPRDSRSCREEFIAQWDEAYGKGFAVAKNPPAWRLSFVLV